MMKLGKIIGDEAVIEKMEGDARFRKDVYMAISGQKLCMWDTRTLRDCFEALRSSKEVKAVFPTVLGDIIIRTNAERSQTIISMA